MKRNLTSGGCNGAMDPVAMGPWIQLHWSCRWSLCSAHTQTIHLAWLVTGQSSRAAVLLVLQQMKCKGVGEMRASRSNSPRVLGELGVHSD